MGRRPGLTRERIVGAAAELVDRDGVDGLSLAALAKRFGVATPSLYNHVAGAEDLRRALRLRGLKLLAAAVREAAVGRAGPDALRAVAHAYRDTARAHPGLYALTQVSAEAADEELRDAGRAVVEVVVAALRGYGLDGDAALHATRCLRSALHGFVTLEADGGFGMDLATDESFDHLVTVVDRGLSAGPPPAGPVS